MTPNTNSGGTPATRQPALAERVTLVSVGEVQTTETGRAFVACHFKKGVFGRPIRRAFWGSPADDGTIQWERATPEELRSMVGQVLTGMVEVVPLDIEDKEFVNPNTGEISVLKNVTIVHLADETVERAAKVFGVVPRQPKVEVQPMPVMHAPAGFHVVGGDGQG